MQLWKRSCRRASAAAFAIVVCASSPCLGAEFTLRKIVDGADPVPGAPGATWQLFGPFFDAAVDGDGLAFIGHWRRLPGGSEEFRDGVYVYRGGSLPLQRIADSDSLRPGMGGPFSHFWRLSMDGGVVAFSNEDRSVGVAGVYKHDGTALQILADQGTVIPGQAPQRFTSFGDVAIDEGAVLFGGGSHHYPPVWNQDGLYLSAAGALGAVVGSSTPVPGGNGTFELVGEVGLDGHGFAFTKPRAGQAFDESIYRNLGTGVEVVADLSTVAPHSGTPFTVVEAFDYDDGATAFVAVAGGHSVVYLEEEDGLLRPIATNETLVPGAGQSFVGLSNRVSTSAGRVAFMGGWKPPGQPNRSALFVANGAELVKIVERGAQLDGRTIAAIDLSQGAFDWPNLAFTVRFEEGGNALYLASLGDGCTPGATTLCLHGSRFAVELEWRSPPGFPALQHALVSSLSTAQTGFLYFVNPENLELLAKVLDGCALNGRYWVFAAAATNVEYTLKITDTSTGAVRTYHNALGERSPAVNDTSAFACP